MKHAKKVPKVQQRQTVSHFSVTVTLATVDTNSTFVFFLLTETFEHCLNILINDHKVPEKLQVSNKLIITDK